MVDTDTIDMKPFKPTGKLYDDIATICKMWQTKVHPALKNPVQEGQEEEQKAPVSTLSFFKHRVDKNSLRALFLTLPTSSHVHTLK